MMENYLVFDMGGSSIKYGILNDNGDILNNSSFKTPATLEVPTSIDGVMNCFVVL